ncbi:MAG TPA: tRNA (adenosine(37)-N6)-threonylcarbamoyltransferase complex dimerization subunit type 1 TsaB [Gemmatimonadales bacterium]|nr:tRNA (adenosine(37)-N6)-threonylcarbamoyltransferase complex dimerization subunit type 1 TsaB [Gemmatimonadales bacterium]
MSDSLLAIDTATDVASVAVGGAGEPPRAVAVVSGARAHAARIVDLVDEVLRLAGIRLDDIRGIVVGDGPGSFTGLRIGWAAARGLAQQRELPLTAVPSLLAAAGAASRIVGSPVAACYDALRGQVYGAVYGFAGAGVETIVAPALFTLDSLAAASRERPRAVVGDGAERYAAEAARWTGAAPLGLAAVSPTAAALLDFAGRPGAARGIADPAAEPVYGRPAEAQAKWEARHGRPLDHPSGHGR